MTAVSLLQTVGASAARWWRAALARLSGRDIARLRQVDVAIRVDTCSAFGQELLQHGLRPSEPFLIPLMQATLREGDTFLDVGAHWGTYAVAAARLVGARGRVVAIEPFGRSFARLRANARLNRCRNLTALKVAVGDRAADGYLLSGGSGDNLTSFHERTPPLRHRSVPAFCRRLLGLPIVLRCRMDTLRRILAAQAVTEVALLKMDIEGSECLAFRDLVGETAFCEVMLVELHPPFAGFSCDRGLLYRVLAEGRDLFVADGPRGRLEQVASAEAFEERMGGYYFLSIRKGSRFATGGESSLNGFAWA